MKKNQVKSMNEIVVTPELLASKQWALDKYTTSLPHPMPQALSYLVLVSDYACKYGTLLQQLVENESCMSLPSREEYFSQVGQLTIQQSQTLFATQLRHFRQKHLLQLLLLDYAGLIEMNEILIAWSDCADALIIHTLAYCQHIVSARYGIPRNEQGIVVSLYVLAMGKLGGRELNYSSDIDLIFTYEHSGETDGDECITNEVFFIKVVQLFIQLMQSNTIDGFVFRVDLRLRPNGESGALALSFAAMEAYYQEQGRDWERYAMIKARVIQRSLETVTQWFERFIIPFTYRRYIDFSVIESLRSMKAMIEHEVQLNPGLDDIKRGKGGIREIEFIIQSIQLIRGGRLPQLQVNNAINALTCLHEEDLLPDAEHLKEAYLYLRRLENALQSLNDQQTHSLPHERLNQEQIILAMHHASWEELLETLHSYQFVVSYSFGQMLGQVHDEKNEHRLLVHQFNSLWHGHIESATAIALLSGLGFSNASQCFQMIYTFRHGSRCKRLSQAARLRLDRLMVILLMELPQYEHTDKVLAGVIHLLEHIVGRSAYLALLTENTFILKELLFCFSRSTYISDLIVNHPFLLEVFLEPHLGWFPASKVQLKKQLVLKLQYIDEMEQKEELLRQFKLMHWLKAARVELHGHGDVVQLGLFLAHVAEVIVQQVIILAMKQLAPRYPDVMNLMARFVVIAYGTLGSREMNYSSDLDLVFLYATHSKEELLVTRLTKKIVYMLTTRTQMGVLFAVDTRLRPSGTAGLLVSSLDAFCEYQQKDAWTWEHQALLKARIIYGSSSMRKTFLMLKKQIIIMPRNKEKLYQAIHEMRMKLEQNFDSDTIKNRAGGLLDFDFLVQYLVLYTQHASLVTLTHPLYLLKKLLLLIILTKKEYSELEEIYKENHTLLRQEALGCKSGTTTLSQKMQLICHKLYQKYH